ncbi:flagellar protein FlaG [Thiobacillus sp.]|uniref:flagellar protein FlaG n=1 Tax=Thiobacillus sp. TaxID=924 RepID=UPI0025F3AC25|nr:flagellar protein FlaG [Thiobacillus sp.]MBT9540485.1 flagellar protein FlaG [Thiobacillus sp.]
MIIPNTSPINQAVQLDGRSHPVAPASAKAVAAPATQPAARQPSSEELNTAVAAINQAMQQSNQSLEFSVDTNTNRTVVKMVDTSTGELIRQFPSESVLAISRGIEEFQQGLLLTQKA